ncbi:helix-turn-helix domain-containing protein [Gracilibacillus oryzae]|uniref:Helix-turn-helix domain-containing protein n=1 Tax=Gracilibacillus oryzae TaxID=1672701 RepID=A0A7C8GQZ3_9BACI|nr:helix-turn-helix domain-containing protein [Gracilibacillus oryzae]KAB8126936.1 helix-turn-helix domain-containing protein [Gracilibacillus oryzae]
MACLYTITEVSKLLGVNKNRVYDLIKAGHLKGLKLGALKVTSFELEAFLQRNNGMDMSDLTEVKKLQFN